MSFFHEHLLIALVFITLPLVGMISAYWLLQLRNDQRTVHESELYFTTYNATHDEEQIRAPLMGPEQQFRRDMVMLGLGKLLFSLFALSLFFSQIF